MWSAKIKVPKIERYLAVAADKTEGIADAEKQIMAKYATVLVALQKAFKPVTSDGREVTLKIGNIKDSIYIDAEEASITFRRDQAKALHLLLRREGMLSVVRHAWEPIARLEALYLERDLHNNFTGRKIVDVDKKLRAVDRLLANLVDYARSEDGPRRFVKKPVDRSKKLAVGRGGFGKRVKEEVLGKFLVGSGMGKLVTALGDGEWHEASDLAKITAPADVWGRINPLKRVGEETGDWVVETNPQHLSQVRLVKKKKE